MLHHRARVPIRGRPRNSGGDPGTLGAPGDRSSRRVSDAGERSAADSSRATGQPSNRHAGLNDRARPLHLIHGGASLYSLCRRCPGRSGSTFFSHNASLSPVSVPRPGRAAVVPRARPGHPRVVRSPANPGGAGLPALDLRHAAFNNFGASTNSAQRVTPRAMADDNETDAGDVGTPELTSPRLSFWPVQGGRGAPAVPRGDIAR